MTDFWELFGRFITKSAFRERLYKSFEVGYYPSDSTKLRIKIPKEDYDEVRKHVKHIMPHRPISLFVGGELLMCISTQIFRDRAEILACQIQETDVPTTGRRSLFYAALGLMFLDDSVRAQFQGGDFESSNFGLLHQQDQDDLSTLAHCGPLKDAAIHLCEIYWGPACFDKFVFYGMHMHPSANPYPPTPPYPGRG
jgi:hypothetical protein